MPGGGGGRKASGRFSAGFFRRRADFSAVAIFRNFFGFLAGVLDGGLSGGGEVGLFRCAFVGAIGGDVEELFPATGGGVRGGCGLRAGGCDVGKSSAVDERGVSANAPNNLEGAGWGVLPERLLCGGECAHFRVFADIADVHSYYLWGKFQRDAVVLSSSMTVAEAVDFIRSYEFTTFPIVDEEWRCVGSITEMRLRRNLVNKNGGALIRELADHCPIVFPFPTGRALRPKARHAST